MSKLTLGLDLGSNSIGWALLDEPGNRVVAAGVRVFPEGVNRDQTGAEVPKNAARRVARGMRRQIRRRAGRKRRLAQLLTRAGLLPPEGDGRAALYRQDPYDLRRRALTESLSLHEFGRVLVHLNQRRGFLSNRRADRKQKKEVKGILAEMGQLEAEITGSDHKFLGKHLACLHDDPHCRIRGKHTKRDMYDREFDALWAEQRKHHAEVLTDALRDRVRKAIFYQRPIRVPKSVIGTCELEPGKPRCPKADRLAQRFRMLQEVNNLRVIDARGDRRPLSEEQRCKLLDYLGAAKSRTFDQIRKHLSLLEGTRFTLQEAEREGMHGMPTDAALAGKKALGKQWHSLAEDRKNAIVQALLEEDEPTVKRRAIEEWGLDEQSAENLLDADLEEGYMQLCREVIAKLLPSLERGLPLMAADDEVSAMSEAGYLRRDQREIAQSDQLPRPPVLTNPIVRQALHEVRKVVNAIVREFGKPARIRIELARDAKAPAKEREKASKEMAKRRRERQAAAAALQEAGQAPTGHFIQRYLLWREQGEICIYSGQPISLVQLLAGDVDVDHILPYGRSLDDSLANKVVCFPQANAEKKDRTPWEWLGERDPARYERLLQAARQLPYNKRRRFEQKALELDEFVQRQLNDTRYISRCVRQYVQHLGADVLCTRGQLTAELRYQWGLNTILDPAGGEKNRADHRHHAIDAIVIALTDRSRLQQLARCRGQEPVSSPWDGLRDQAQAVVGKIVVSHRVQRKVAGALHEETLYGSTDKPAGTDPIRPWAKGWREGKGVFVRRKPVEELSATGHLNKVRDDTVREVLREHLRKNGIDPDRDAKIPPAVWANPPTMRHRKGRPGPVIRKVRMIEESETFRPLRGSVYVKPGSNHHIAYYLRGDGTWRPEPVTTLEAAARLRRREPAVSAGSQDGEPLVMSLSIGECFLIEQEGQARICVVRMIDQRSNRVHYKYHSDARPAANIKKDNLYASPGKLQEMNARKLTLDPLGRLRWAGD